MSDFLFPHQLDAVKRIFNGCILAGGVGSGKSRTGLAYYFMQQNGEVMPEYVPMKNPKNLIIITTAKKRDDHDWEKELNPFLMSTKPDLNYYKNKIIVDSWQNIKKYANTVNSFFIFDEDHLTGYGAWTKAFLQIAKHNEWIILSATPGDCWMDYMPVFVANGFYKNKTDFVTQHVIYNYRVSYHPIDRYVNTKRLERLRNRILIDMDFERQTVRHHENVFVGYDRILYRRLMRDRWNIWEDRPIKNASELCYSLRKLVNSDEERQTKLLELLEDHPRAIIFYNHSYELQILRNLGYSPGTEIAEWNSSAHQEIPKGNKWVYLVQYIAGCEGWNCVETDTIIFYSQNYSYKVMEQAYGRIDRLNTPYTDLYYYHFKSHSGIDLAINRALVEKKRFNETRFAKE